MKFLLVGTNPENTGAATHFVALAEALVEAGHEVDVVASPGSLIAQELAGTRVRLHHGRFRNVLDLRGYAKVYVAARQLRPDWLIGNFGKEYWPLIVVGRLLRIPVALFRHRTPPMKKLSAWLLPRLARRFFAVSNHARQAYLDRGIAAARVQVLYNPVNMTRCQPDAQRRAMILRDLGIGEDAIVLGYAGRMHASKGIFTLLEAVTAAMAEEPGLHCLWLGDGPDAPALREQAAAGPFASRHHFTGWINEVHPWYSAMSMLAFPSLAPETFGRVSVEAQAAEVPVLGSNIGGIPETMQAGVTGLLLPPGDSQAWREAILTLCAPATRQAMGTEARQFVQRHFSTTVIAAQLVRSLTEARLRDPGAPLGKHSHHAAS
jgi:glycosyltransferase involved in cell wall biosynthesis